MWLCDMIEKFVPATIDKVDGYEFAFDVSSKSKQFSSFSPFNNLDNIPHPCSKDILCKSVECIWQGSKVFSLENPAPDYFVLFGKKSFMKNKGKKPLGTWAGGHDIITNVGDARRTVYIPAYRWVLDNRLRLQVKRILKIARSHQRKRMYLYDFNDNFDVDNPAPLAHCSVLAQYLNEKYNDKHFMRDIE